MVALNKVTLTGNLGAAAAGALAVFTPSDWLPAPADSLLAPPAPVQVTLNASGTFSVSLYATDNADFPAGWTWTAAVSGIPGVAQYSFSFALPFTSGATQDISALAHVTPANLPASLPLPSGTAISGEVPLATGTGSATQWTPVLRKVADTGAAGFALQNGTPNILSWTAPADSAVHPVLVFANLHVTSGETGGEIDVALTLPDGSAYQPGLFNPSLGAGGREISNPVYLIQAASTITVLQQSPLTGGAAVLWAQIWAA